MTKTKIKKLLSNIENIEIYGRGKNWTIETDSDVEYEKVKKILQAEGIACGGYQCGHGGWILSANYIMPTHDNPNPPKEEAEQITFINWIRQTYPACDVPYPQTTKKMEQKSNEPRKQTT